MKFSELLACSRKIQTEPSRIGKIEIIQQYLEKLDEKDAEIGVHYIAGRLPQGKINVVWKRLSGLLNLSYKKRKSLSLREINQTMEMVKNAHGKKKYQLLTPLFESMTREERKYLLSLIYGEAQQGAGEGLVKLAIAGYFKINDKDIEEAYLHNPDLGKLFHLFLTKGSKAIKQVNIQLFRPVKPMLAQTSESINDVLKHLDQPAVEYKLDGLRIQVHKDEEKVRIFSRNLRDRTVHFPELVEFAKGIRTKRCILDGEAIALDKKGKIVPFQILAKRTTRKKDIEETMKDIPVRPQFFDVIYLDNDDLTSLPYQERFQVLIDIIPDDIYRATRILAKKTGAVRSFFEEAVKAGNEGIVIKNLDAPYRPGKRGKHWFKIKQTYTLDCVILAADWGHGRRTGWLSNLHLGVFDETRTRFLMVGKTFKGMTDKMLQWFTDNLPRYKVHEDKWTLYVRPVVVVEVVFNEVQKSPKYDSGFALRFARVKQIRADKKSREIDSILELEQLFKMREGVNPGI